MDNKLFSCIKLINLPNLETRPNWKMSNSWKSGRSLVPERMRKTGSPEIWIDKLSNSQILKREHGEWTNLG